MKNKLFWFLFASLLSGCASTLLDDVYKHTNSSDSKEMYTSFIILSNMELNDQHIDKMEQTYISESDSERKYLFEFVLAKRTQQEEYVLRFIDSTKDNISLLTSNNSNWIAISSPVLDQVAYYSKTNDEALGALLLLVLEADGAILEVVSSDLRSAYKIDPIRFSNVAEKMDLDVGKILLLVEDE